jgi:5-dehydro-2-deoxygluconokinase
MERAADRLARLRRNRFTVLGRVGLDLYADPPGTRIEDATSYMAAIGGSAGNIAVALARQAAGVALVTRVSDDAVGAYCLAELRRYGVDTRHVRRVAEGTRTSLAVVETRADAQAILYRNGAADLALTAHDTAAIDHGGSGAIIVTGTALASAPSRQATRAAMAAAAQAGAVVVLDIDYRAMSWNSAAEATVVCLEAAQAADVVIGNDEEFGLLAGGRSEGPALAATLARRALFTVLKRGADGARTFVADHAFDTPVFPVVARKPMGAGDGFMGGLMAGLAAGHDLPAAVRRGAATAAIIVAGVGCAPASPDTAALDAFIARH